MIETELHPGSHLEDIDIFIDLCSSKVDLDTLSKITTSLTEIVTTLAPEVALVEREKKITESPGKTLRRIRVHFQIK